MTVMGALRYASQCCLDTTHSSRSGLDSFDNSFINGVAKCKGILLRPPEGSQLSWSLQLLSLSSEV